MFRSIFEVLCDKVGVCNFFGGLRIWQINIDTKDKIKIKRNSEKFLGILCSVLLKDCNNIDLVIKDIICFEVFLKFLIFYLNFLNFISFLNIIYFKSN